MVVNLQCVKLRDRLPKAFRITLRIWLSRDMQQNVLRDLDQRSKYYL